VLHEFGHALGLIHEHQSPASGIPWNRDAVYTSLSGSPNYWDRQTIDANLFQAYDQAETNYTRTDPDSIMMYPIPPSWTDGKYTVGLNSALSRTDLEFIRQIYS
jgi:hypothetical protein